MRKSYITLTALALTLSGWQTAAAAQFPRLPKVEVPKVGKPKAEQPTTAQPAPAGSPAQPAPGGADANAGAGPAKPSGGGARESAGLNRPEAGGKPVLLKDTLEVWAHRLNYWKTEDNSAQWSWLPQVRFHIFFDNSSTQRYNAEWYKPDGC